MLRAEKQKGKKILQVEREKSRDNWIRVALDTYGLVCFCAINPVPIFSEWCYKDSKHPMRDQHLYPAMPSSMYQVGVE